MKKSMLKGVALLLAVAGAAGAKAQDGNVLPWKSSFSMSADFAVREIDALDVK